MAIVQDIREFAAAKVSLLRSNWPTQTRPPDVDIRYGLSALRARSRHEAQNADHMRSFLRHVKANIIGPDGVLLQSKAELRNGKPNERLRDALEERWNEWGEFGNCEVTGSTSWTDEQQRCVETIARDGEGLYRLVPWDNEWLFALQCIDPDQLDVQYNERLSDDAFVVMGVEMDRWRRPRAYYILDEDPLLRGPRVFRPRKRVRVPAEDLLHLYLPEWCVQTRGVPWAATALKRLTDLNGYEEAAVVNARGGASKMGFYEQTEEAASLVRDDGTTESGALASGETTEGKLYEKFEPGTMGVLPPGYTFKGWDPQFPTWEHANFVKAVLKPISAGLGINYNRLNNDLEGVNYTSLREGNLNERDLWKLLQKWIIGAFHNRVYRRWLEVQLGAGLLAVNGRPVPMSMARELRRVAWQPRRWEWVDPQKESAAAREETTMLSKSVSEIIRNRGADPDTVWKEIAAERERWKELGIEQAEATAAAVAVEPEEDEDETTQD